MEDKVSETLVLDKIYSKIGFGKFHLIIIILFGMLQCFDATELILLAFLGPVLTCEWQISMLESSMITTSVFIGMIFGSLTLGKFSDVYGRKTTIIVSVSGILYFSLSCAASSSVIWVIITRLLIGTFIGGTTIMISTFLAEIMPIQYRGIAQMSVQVFWSLGSYYISLLTVILVPKFGWRLWLVISICPMILMIPVILWLPETPRYLLLMDKKIEALEIINRIAKMNGQDMVSDVKNIEFKPSSIYDIFHPNYAMTTIISTYVCFVAGISYYGFVLSSSIINDIPHKCLQNMSMIMDSSTYSNVSVDNSCCFSQSWRTMNTVFISITGELISYICAILLIRYIKRKVYIQILTIIIAIVFFLLNLCLSPHFIGLLMMFGRGSSITMLGITYLYISEVFPTTIRSFSIGIGSSFARIGAISSSFIINIIMAQSSYMGSTIFYSALNIISCFLIIFLPIETRNRELLQNVEEEISQK